MELKINIPNNFDLPIVFNLQNKTLKIDFIPAYLAIEILKIHDYLEDNLISYIKICQKITKLILKEFFKTQDYLEIKKELTLDATVLISEYIITYISAIFNQEKQDIKKKIQDHNQKMKKILMNS